MQVMEYKNNWESHLKVINNRETKERWPAYEVLSFIPVWFDETESQARARACGKK